MGEQQVEERREEGGQPVVAIVSGRAGGGCAHFFAKAYSCKGNEANTDNLTRRIRRNQDDVNKERFVSTAVQSVELRRR